MSKFDLYFSPDDGVFFRKVRVSAVRLPDGSVFDSNGWRATSEAKVKSDDWLTALRAALPIPLEYELKIKRQQGSPNGLIIDYHELGNFYQSFTLTPGDMLSLKGIPTVDDIPMANWEISYER